MAADTVKGGKPKSVSVCHENEGMEYRLGCAGYLTHPSVLWNFKHEFRQSTPIFPSTKMSLKDHFQKNTPFTDRQLQLDLISRSSIDTIHPCSSSSDAE